MIRIRPFKIVQESFQARIVCFLGLLILVVSVAFTTLYVHHESGSHRVRLTTEGELLVRLLAYNSRLAVFAEQESMLKKAADGILQYNHAVLSATVYAADGKILAKRIRAGKEGRDREEGGPPAGIPPFARLLKGETRIALIEKADRVEFFAPIEAGERYTSPESLYFSETPAGNKGRTIGFVRVILDKKNLNESLHKILVTALFMAALFLVLASFVAYLLARGLTRPLSGLMEGVQTMGQGNLSGRIPVATHDELGKVSLAFNLMAEALEKREAENRGLEEQLRFVQKQEAKEEWERTFDTMPDLIAILDEGNCIVRINKSMADRLAISKDEAAGTMLYDRLHVDATPADFSRRSDLLAAGATYCGEVYEEILGSFFFFTVSPFLKSDGSIAGSVYVARDITEHKNLQTQLYHSQKMEAIGQIAGGVAHDFNNLLTAIIGFANLAETSMNTDDPNKQYLGHILAAADRAARLTQGLLAFSSRQIVDPHPIDVNDVVRSMEKLLARLITEDIEMKTTLLYTELLVMADSSQIDQILMNLAANARDAMPNGGVLALETGVYAMTDDYVRTHGYGTVGQYAMLAVSDTGAGMDEVTRSRVFEPFFTTKEVGKGTGLGLSIVYGIVKQHNGFINVYSEPGEGTVFKIYFPLIKADKALLQLTKDPQAVMGGTETVLVVEDNPEVRNFTRSLLEAYGYKVIEAVDGQDGVEKFARHRDDIKLVMTDVVMPKMSGKDAIAEMSKIRPGVKSLFTSGYTRDIVHEKGILVEGINYISKPSQPQELLKKVREILDNS